MDMIYSIINLPNAHHIPHTGDYDIMNIVLSIWPGGHISPNSPCYHVLSHNYRWSVLICLCSKHRCAMWRLTAYSSSEYYHAMTQKSPLLTSEATYMQVYHKIATLLSRDKHVWVGICIRQDIYSLNVCHGWRLIIYVSMPFTIAMTFCFNARNSK